MNPRLLLMLAGLVVALPVYAQLTLHLKFDDSTNLALDSSGNGYVPSVFYGAPTYTSPGVSGGAAQFNGGEYYLWYNPVPATLAGSFSVSLWVKTTQSFGYNTDRGWEGVGIVYADQPGQAQDTIPIALNGGVAGFMTSDGVQDTTLHTTSAINGGSYVHLVSTYDIVSGVKNLYFNGQLQATETVVPTTLNVRNLLVLGANEFDGRFFSGALDDFQFYSKPLTGVEVSYLYANPGFTVVPEPPVWLLVGGGAVLLRLTQRLRQRGSPAA